MNPRTWYALVSNPEGGCDIGPFRTQLEATQLAVVLLGMGADGVRVESRGCFACDGAGVVGDGLCCMCVPGHA